MAASGIAERLTALPLGRDLPGEVIRVYGDLRGKLDGDLIALGGTADQVLTVEEGGVFRRFDLKTGFQLEAIPLSELEAEWTFADDGHFLASGGFDVGIWEVADGMQLETLEVPAWVTSQAFSNDGALLATGHDDNTVRVWSVPGGKLLWSLTKHEAELSAIAFSHDGLKLATAGEDRLVVIWNVENGVAERELVGHTDRVAALAWSHTGDLLASAAWDTSVRLWDTQTGELKAMLNGQGERVNCVAFMPDDSALVCGDSDGIVRIWDHGKLKPIRTFDGHRVDIRQLRVFDGGKRIVFGGLDRTLIFWNLTDDQTIPDAAAPSKAITGLETTGEDQIVAVHEGGGLSIWDFETSLKFEGPECPPVAVVATDAKGNWAAGHLDGSITYFPIGEDRGEKHWQAHDAQVHHLALQPTGKLLASAAGADGTVHLWNAETSEPVLIIPLAVEACVVEALAFHPNRELLAVGGIDWMATGERDGGVAMWNWRTRSKEIVLPGAASRLVFSKNGNLLAGVNPDGAALIWDFLSATLAEEIAVRGAAISAIAFDPSGELFVTGCDDGGVRVWSTTDWKLQSAYDLETPPKALQFTPDGQAILVGNANACCYLIDLSGLSGPA